MMRGPARFYFDHNATAPLLEQARDAAMRAFSEGGNPSSVHAEGRRARQTVETAREEVAALVGARPENVVFTSGASEAAHLALSPVWTRDGQAVRMHSLAVCESDHPCLIAGGRFEPGQMHVLPIDRNGVLEREALAHWAQGEAPGVLALALANNESGVMQPLGPVHAALGARGHCRVLDVVQAAGRIPLDIEMLGADALILSGHKIGALGGVGALVLRDGALAPQAAIRGGAQERRLRAGTENVAAIASFGAAACVARARTAADRARMAQRRALLEARLLAAHPRAVIVGAACERLANTILVAAPGLNGETAQIALDLQGFAVSSGSACASGKVAASPVLIAHARAGLDIDPRMGALRLSFGFDTTDAAIDAMGEAVSRLLHRAAKSREAERAV